VLIEQHTKFKDKHLQRAAHWATIYQAACKD
jgi:hypothetical protein